MNKYLSYILLFIIPLLFFISGSYLKYAQGPYYLNFYDPGYVYLINSLNLAQGFGVGHFDHPGTTVQVIGAVIIKIYHALSSGGSDPDIVKDVFSRPEEYLFVMNKIFTMINCIVLFILGVFTLRITGNLILSLLIQLSPFASMEIFYGMIIVTPENFLICVTLLFTGLLICYLYGTDESKKTPLKLIVAFAIVCGLGLATKLNFLPMLIIPLFLLKGIKDKIIFISISILSFIIFVLPALSNFNNFISWIEKLFLFSGHYGSGTATVIDSSSFAENLKLIFNKDGFFTATDIISAAALLITVFRKPKPEQSGYYRFMKDRKLLMLIFIAVNFQIIMVAKQYAQYYLIPSFILCIFSLILCSSLLILIFKNYSAKLSLKHLFILIMLSVSSWSLWNIVLSYSEGTQQKTEAYKIEKFIKENYPGKLVVSSFGSASKECALAFAMPYAAGQTARYEDLLSRMQSAHIFYNPWGNQFYSISKTEDIKSSLMKNKNFILQLNYYGSSDEFIKTLDLICGVKGSLYKKIFTNGNNESVYEINIGDK